MNHFLSLQENDLEPLNDGVINEQRCNEDHFYRAMLCIRGTSHGPVSVRPSVRPSQVGVLSKRMNESSWVLACELPSTRPTLY